MKISTSVYNSSLDSNLTDNIGCHIAVLGITKMHFNENIKIDFCAIEGSSA